MKNQWISKLAGELKKQELAAIMVCPSKEMAFLTGFSPMSCERFQALFVTSGAQCFYICNRLYTGEMIHSFGPDVPVYDWLDGESISATVSEVFEKYGLMGKKIAVNSTARAFNILDFQQDIDARFVNGKWLLEEVRIFKTPEEIENMRASARIVDDIFPQVAAYIKPGLKEADIIAFIRERMVAQGGEPQFIIVASGPNSSYPHYSGSDRVIEKQDIIVLDYGCTVNNMFSDISRVVFVGQPTPEQRRIYEIVLSSTLAGERAAVSGAWIPDVDRAARKVIEDAGYGENFFLRLGHGIGQMGHEAPDIKKNNERRLEPGMAFSIEPGVYIAGRFGMRVEDIVVTTPDGNEVLNQASREMTIV